MAGRGTTLSLSTCNKTMDCERKAGFTLVHKLERKSACLCLFSEQKVTETLTQQAVIVFARTTVHQPAGRRQLPAGCRPVQGHRENPMAGTTNSMEWQPDEVTRALTPFCLRHPQPFPPLVKFRRNYPLSVTSTPSWPWSYYVIFRSSCQQTDCGLCVGFYGEDQSRRCRSNAPVPAQQAPVQ